MLLMKESVLNFEKKQKNIGLPTFKLPASNTNLLRRPSVRTSRRLFPI